MSNAEENKKFNRRIQIAVAAGLGVLLIGGAALLSTVNNTAHTPDEHNTNRPNLPTSEFINYPQAPAPTDPHQKHVYDVANETLQSIGASNYDLTVDSEWLDGNWGVNRFGTNQITISSAVPDEKIDDVIIHEYEHIKQGRLTNGNYNLAVEAAGGTHEDLEIQADEWACTDGATYVYYIATCPAPTTK